MSEPVDAAPETEPPFAGGALRLTRRGSIATLLFDRAPKRNAFDHAMWRALPEITARIEADEGVRVVIVRGAGENFCAGADIGEFAETYADAASAARFNGAVRAAQAALRKLPRPVLALVEGACVGGGCGLALACDLRFAAKTARFGITPARLGLAYSFHDTMQLVEKVGAAAAKDILFSARLLDAPEALSLGLVDRVFPPERVEAETLAYAENLAALSQNSIRAAKTMANAAADHLAEKLSTRFADLFAASFSGPDFEEGRAAFLERRPPRFTREP